MLMAKRLTFPEVLTKYNSKRLRQCLMNGPDVYPGATHVSLGSKPKEKYFLANTKVRMKFLEHIKYGDIIHRHLIKDDVVLFNR